MEFVDNSIGYSPLWIPWYFFFFLLIYFEGSVGLLQNSFLPSKSLKDRPLGLGPARGPDICLRECLLVGKTFTSFFFFFLKAHNIRCILSTDFPVWIVKFEVLSAGKKFDQSAIESGATVLGRTRGGVALKLSFLFVRHCRKKRRRRGRAVFFFFLARTHIIILSGGRVEIKWKKKKNIPPGRIFTVKALGRFCRTGRWRVVVFPLDGGEEKKKKW